MNRSRALLTAALALLLCASIGAAFIRVLRQRVLESERRSSSDLVTARSYAIEKEIERAASVAYAGAALARTGDVSDAALAEVARRLPAGRLLFSKTEDPSDEDAHRAAETRQLVFGAPSSRLGEGLTLTGYLPVYRSNTLAGFVVVSAPMAELERTTGLSILVDRGFDYSITRNADGRVSLVARSTEIPLHDPMEIPIQVPGGNWVLSAAPRNGWGSGTTTAREAAAAAILSVLIALFIYDLLLRPERLEREVELRARRLLDANRKLMAETTGRERAEELALYEATHDRLTGLPNRAHFLTRMSRMLERSLADPNFGWSVLLINLDRFKGINDGLGQSAGDRVLTETAKRLEASLRTEDVVSRIGADEFALLLFGGADVLAITHIAQRTQEKVRQDFEIDGEMISLTASIGIAQSTTAYSRPEEPLRDANLAMHTAKLEGGGRQVIFDRAMHERALLLSRTERDLRTAIERNELRAYYQPIVSLDTGLVTGFEALVRWQHPEKGFISPGAFLPVAESTGQVVPIDRWMLQEASRFVRDLAVSGLNFSISVNLSGKQFSDPDLVDVIRESLLQSCLDPTQLRLEITESVMMENTDSALQTLRELKKLDVRISLDDFGTGYSSLSYIRQFPIDFLKIDRSFVSRMTENQKDEEIVRIILVLADSLGLKVIAEGIETPQHLAHLRALNCAYGQGYLFSKPIDGAAMHQFLAAKPRW